MELSDWFKGFEKGIAAYHPNKEKPSFRNVAIIA